MLKRIYIDNFRCLVNFELDFDAINLFLGSNGVGKSTVFEVLQKIQLFISGDSKIETIFKSVDCTRWQSSKLQSFELEIIGNDGIYKYELGITCEKKDKVRVEYERLWFNNQSLLKFESGDVQIYKDDYSKDSQFSFNWSQSIFPSLMTKSDNSKLTWFRERMARFIIVRVMPSLMIDESIQPEIYLTSQMENYVSWYRYFSEDQGKVAEVGDILREVIDGFRNFKFERVSEQSLVLKIRFSSATDSNKFIDYRFGELSDGQKALITLYTLIHGTKSSDYTLCIDEPENFLALPEIQPWLAQLYDLCSDGELQALLISHHPELINYLLASPIGYWFERRSNAPARVKRIGSEIPNDSALPVSELIARGWLNESA
ncbi:MAG: AAA family ATPase [Scytonematopsis contorta HA4267-MV1]|jgi:predicted ATPase|nr:AAA family ATPase [Scytonematopsis contorta HA4267-MV1]